MKKGFTRLLSLLLGLLLVASISAGCGKTGTKPAENSTAQAQSTVTSEQTAKAEPVKIVMERPLWGNADSNSKPNIRIREKIKEKINIDVEVVGQQNPSNQAEKPNLMLAAGEPLDIFQTPYDVVGGTSWQKYKKEGMIIPLNDLLDKYGQDMLKSIDPAALNACTDKDGKIWALPDEMQPVTSAFAMRKDWLDKYNLQVPDTFEDLEKVLQVFKEKENDQGFLPYFGESSIDFIFCGSFIPTGDQNYLDSDGKIKSHYLHPGYKDFLAKMNDWYKKGYLHKEAGTMSYQQVDEIWNSGKASMNILWANGSIKAYIDAMKKNVPGADLIVVAPPRGPAGRLIDKALPITSNIMIAKSSKNPEKAMEFLNWSQATDEGWLLSKYGEEGYDWNWVDKDNGILNFTDKKAEEDRYGYAIFCSTRLNAFTQKYSVSDKPVKDETAAIMLDEAKYPSKFPVDLKIVYDVNKMKSKDQQTALNTMLTEAKWKIIMGQKPVSYWDEVLKQWLKAGGQQYIDDLTEQFNAQNSK